MEPVELVTGTAVPLNRSDVDTDQIIPSDWLKQVTRTGFGRGLFSQWRDDPSFILNNENYGGATILLAGANFGVGSSREHAVWAIQQYGFAAVISPRFGDIFKNNSTKNGLLPVALSATKVKELMDAVELNPALEITISVADLTVEAPEIGFAESFELAASIQERFLKGLDDIAISLQYEAAIDSYEQQRPAWA